MNVKTAFTLIELLVVIAIIGILSGLIIVGMNSSVQSATTAKAQIFSASLRDSLLADLVSEWKLDQAPSNITPDSWASNNCTLTGAGGLPVLQTSGCVYDGCISFDGVDDYLDCGANANLNISNTVTMEAWIKISNLSSENQIMAKHDGTGYQAANYGLEVRSSNLRVWFGDGTNSRIYQGGSPKANTWMHVVGTIASSNDIKAYINGVEISGSYSGTATTMATNSRILKIGLKAANIGLAGYLDGIRLYNKAISSSLIKSNYYSGINRLLANEKIEWADYSEKIKTIN